MAGNVRIQIYKDEEKGYDLVEKKLIGDPNTVIYKMSQVEEEIKRDFPEEYNNYYKKKKVELKGTSLSKLKMLNKNKRTFFEIEGITTIEQLSDLSDGACHGLGKDVLDCRKAAKEFLAKMNNTKPVQVVGNK
jgi:hypothetical protein